MDNVFETPQPSEEYKVRQSELIQNAIFEIGIVDESQKGNKELNPQQSGSTVENIIKNLGL